MNSSVLLVVLECKCKSGHVPKGLSELAQTSSYIDNLTYYYVDTVVVHMNMSIVLECMCECGDGTCIKGDSESRHYKTFIFFLKGKLKLKHMFTLC